MRMASLLLVMTLLAATQSPSVRASRPHAAVLPRDIIFRKDGQGAGTLRLKTARAEHRFAGESTPVTAAALLAQLHDATRAGFVPGRLLLVLRDGTEARSDDVRVSPPGYRAPYGLAIAY